MNRLWVGFMFTVAMTMPSCSLIRRSRGPAPPPVIAAPPTKPNTPVENPQVPPPPKVEQAEGPKLAPSVATQIPAKPPVIPKPVKKPSKRSPAPVKAQAPPPPVVDPAVPTTVAEAPALLAPILSPAQQEAFGKAIDLALQQAENGLASIANKELNATQRANADRTKSFIAQANQFRASDLVTAKSLADRAVVLAQSLAAELR
jgi:hypothetical protein